MFRRLVHYEIASQFLVLRSQKNKRLAVSRIWLVKGIAEASMVAFSIIS